MFKKILVAIDGSELSKKALEVALDIAEKNESKVELISVSQSSIMPFVTFPAIVPTASYTEAFNDYVKELKEHHKKILTETQKEISKQKPYLEVSIFYAEGRPADMIIKTAKDEKCDLIVIGSHGLSGIKRFFLGSVSSGVVNESSIPVLIVK